ncbi:MAG: glycine C-acetyltransferase [Deltaproteobacteria bacterium]|nr:glycine C-acetyltransferase [Deltaproteobacteria bacterium]
MYIRLKPILETELKSIRKAGLWKEEWPILSPQAADIKVKQGNVINFCANNYLGLANNKELIEAGKKALEKYGYGMASVRFICGTAEVHKELEETTSRFFGTDDTILYSSCFDANGGLFETLLGEQDAIISDQLNHASIIDGVRLCKAKRFRYLNSDMNDLEKQLKDADAQGARLKMVATDGVFSMDGYIAKVDQICSLAEKYGAIVMVDDSHATGFIGKTGRGTPEHCNAMKKVDVITSTLGKALGGASGGFTTGRKEIIDLLRQRSRPYLFSNTLAPVITAVSIEVFKMLSKTTALRDKLEDNTKYFRSEMAKTGFKIKEGVHPITPIMLGDAKLASGIARDMLGEGIYVKGFSYPVVPKGEARIRVQISTAHTKSHLDKAIAAFTKIGKKHKVI